MKTFAIALFLASTSAIQIRNRFAAGVSDDEILNNRMGANATAQANATFANASNASFGNATFGNATFSLAEGNATYANASFANVSSNSTFANATANATFAQGPLPFCDSETGAPGVNCRVRSGDQPIYLTHRQ